MTERKEQGVSRPQEQRGESSIERNFVNKGLSVFHSLEMSSRNVKIILLI